MSKEWLRLSFGLFFRHLPILLRLFKSIEKIFGIIIIIAIVTTLVFLFFENRPLLAIVSSPREGASGTQVLTV